ncbi:MAG: phage tail tape measure protein [Desulfovibrio sp.]|jgi:TP901 family phage tail tape measure protein|nr:phage tail tape measure protein [Desulfovibrio sp.]
MSKSLGVGFLIGATLSPSVASAFSTVEQKIQAARKEMGAASKQASVMTKALDLRSKRDELSAKLKASGGANPALRMELAKVADAYRKAKTAAAGYGGAVSDWSRRQAEAQSRLSKANAVLSLNSRIKENADKRKELRGRMMDAIGPVMAVAAPVKLAIDYESAMADVKKVTNFDAPGFRQFSDDILKLSTRIPMSAKGLAEIAAAAGQAGIAESELLRFTEDAAMMAVAFDISAAEAGGAMTGLRTNFKLNQDGVIALGDTFNHLANNMDARAGDLINFANRVGGTATIYGFTGDQVGALGAALVAMKVPAEVGARAVNALMMKLGNASKLGTDAQKAFKQLKFNGAQLEEAFKKNGQGAMLGFLESLKQSKDPMAALQAILGEGFSDEIAKLVSGLDTYKQAINLSEDTAGKAESMRKEYAARAKTTANAIELLKNSVARLGINLGSILLPPLNSLLNIVSPLVNGLSAFAQKHEVLTKLVVGVATGLVTVKVAMLAGGYAATYLSGGIMGVSKLLGIFVPSVAAATSVSQVLSLALKGVGAAMKFAFGPWGLIIGVATLAFGYLWEKFEWFREGFTSLWEGLASVPGLLAEAFSGAIDEMTESIKEFFSGIPILGDAFRGLGKFFFGEDKKADAAKSAAVEPVTDKAGLVPKAGKSGEAPQGGQAMPSQAAPESAASAGAPKAASTGGVPASGVQASFSFSINGAPDEEFARGVINALKRRRSDFESLVSSVVHDQMRVAYGS